MLPLLNHYGFAGRQSFQNGFRALVAGGGTGDATIFLADLADYNAMEETAYLLRNPKNATRLLSPQKNFSKDWMTKSI